MTGGAVGPGDDRGAFRIVAIGDIHIYRPCLNPLRLLNKRMAAQLNACLNPGRKFDETLLAPTLERAAGLDADLLLLTGDLTTSAMAAEFAAVGAAIDVVRDRLGDTPVLALPGNHDRYTGPATRRRIMERSLPGLTPDRFPMLRPLAGRWHMLLIDAARPVLTSSRGRLGMVQLIEIEKRLAELDDDVGLVVASHYPWAVPPGEHIAPQHELADAAELHGLLRGCARPVVFLHGHVHRPWRWRPREVAMHHVLSVNVGAPTRVSDDFSHGQGFLQIDLPASAADPVILTQHQLGGPPGAPHDAAVWSATTVAAR